MQNRLGAKFNNMVVGWQSGKYKLILTRFEDDLNTSSIEYLHRSLLDKWHNAVEQTMPKAAKDF